MSGVSVGDTIRHEGKEWEVVEVFVGTGYRLQADDGEETTIPHTLLRLRNDTNVVD